MQETISMKIKRIFYINLIGLLWIIVCSILVNFIKIVSDNNMNENSFLQILSTISIRIMWAYPFFLFYLIISLVLDWFLLKIVKAHIRDAMITELLLFVIPYLFTIFSINYLLDGIVFFIILLFIILIQYRKFVYFLSLSPTDNS